MNLCRTVTIQPRNLSFYESLAAADIGYLVEIELHQLLFDFNSNLKCIRMFISKTCECGN